MTRVLLVNPPIYDFTAYDFWLKPLGMLTAAARLPNTAHLELFDFLDRAHPFVKYQLTKNRGAFSRGPFPKQKIPKPAIFRSIPRHFYRFGLDISTFQQFLRSRPPFDLVLVQTVMTYWYPGYQEVIDTVRSISPGTKIAGGGFYASLLPGHARKIGFDFVIDSADLSPLANTVSIESETTYRPPRWDLYPRLTSAALQLTTGCPFRCTYCAVGQRNEPFTPRPLEHVTADLDAILQTGATDIAFYDDALLCQPEKTLIPFLKKIIQSSARLNLHTPNALHARLITPELAGLLVRAGTKTFYLGFESSSKSFQNRTGGKVENPDLARAVNLLLASGANPSHITAYEILGHPQAPLQHLEDSIRYAHSLGIRVMLSDFSPIPGTPDGELARQWIDLDEPLTHNKTYFPIQMLGFDRANYYKNLARQLNRSLANAHSS